MFAFSNFQVNFSLYSFCITIYLRIRFVPACEGMFRTVVCDGLKGLRIECLLGEPLRRRNLLTGVASPRSPAMYCVAPNRPWYDLVLGSTNIRRTRLRFSNNIYFSFLFSIILNTLETEYRIREIQNRTYYEQSGAARPWAERRSGLARGSTGPGC